jgi:glycerophosphoryl diester phosphodiesterase
VTGIAYNRRVSGMSFAKARQLCLLWANGACARRTCSRTSVTCSSIKDRIPTLWEALKAAKRADLRVFLDIKMTAPTDEARRRVIGAFLDTGMHKRAVIIGFHGAMLADIRTAARAQGWTPTLGLLVGHAMSVGAIQDAAPGLTWAIPTHSAITPDYVTQLHEAGFKVGTWTPNTPEAWRPVVAAGVDAILTDQVADLIADQP